MEHNKLG